jgi:hypothetical protein
MKYVCVVGRLIPWFLALLLASGCSGFEPLELTNAREEGPEKGLFSGTDGEFVILRRTDEDFAANADEPVTDEASKIKE